MNNYESILYDIISGEDSLHIDNRISALDLKFPKQMCVLVVNPSEKKNEKQVNGFLENDIKRLFPLSCSICYNEFIIVEVPVKEGSPISGDKFNKLSEIAVRENVQIGISNIFSNVSELKHYFNQAFSALVISKKLKDEGVLHKYEIYWFYDLLSKSRIDEITLSDYCHPALRNLYEFDYYNSTDYVTTLKVYLECGCSIKKTSDVLFIHRNSLSYRLERIEEIGSIDLSSVDVKHALVSSYKIYRFLGKV